MKMKTNKLSFNWIDKVDGMITKYFYHFIKHKIQKKNVFENKYYYYYLFLRVG